MNGLTKRIHQDLSEIATRTTPSRDAWQQIQQRIEAAGDKYQMEVAMIDTDEQQGLRRRPVALAAAAAAVIVVLAAVVLAVNDGSDDQVRVAGQPDDSGTSDRGGRLDQTGGSNVDAPVTITVDGRSYVLTEPEVCFLGSDDPSADRPLVHVVGRTDDGLRVELGLHHEADPIDSTDPAGYTGRLSIHEGATASSWRPAVTPEPWPGLSIGSTGVSGEVTMTDATGEAVEVTMFITCDS